MRTQDILRSYAMSWLLRPYRWGGDDFLGVDCSGLCLELLRAAGMWDQTDTTAQGLYQHFSRHYANVALGFGALHFYGQSTHAIIHVAFGLDTHLVIEAGSGNSKTVNVQKAAEQNAWVRIRPIDHRPDRVASFTPEYEFLTYP